MAKAGSGAGCACVIFVLALGGLVTTLVRILGPDDWNKPINGKSKHTIVQEPVLNSTGYVSFTDYDFPGFEVYSSLNESTDATSCGMQCNRTAGCVGFVMVAENECLLKRYGAFIRYQNSSTIPRAGCNSTQNNTYMHPLMAQEWQNGPFMKSGNAHCMVDENTPQFGPILGDINTMYVQNKCAGTFLLNQREIKCISAGGMVECRL